MNSLAVHLHAREEELFALYTSVPGVLFYVAIETDGDFRFQSVSRDFLVVTGLTRQQVVGSLVRDVIPQPSLGMVLNQYRKAIRSGQPVRWQEESVYPAGRKCGEVAVSPLYDANGVATHLIGIVHDVTESIRMEEERAEGDRRTVAHRSCISCGSANLINLGGELALRFPGLQNLNKPSLFVFPEVVVCLDCGASKFEIPQSELQRLKSLNSPG